MSHDGAVSVRPGRRGELDLMGMLVVLGLVFFHTAQIFAGSDFHVMNVPPSVLALFFIAFGSLWGMPLMFLIAGMAIWFSLRKRTPGEFVRERFKRLIVPLVTGVVLLMPVQIYYELKGDPAYHESYLQFYPRFFDVRLSPSFPMFIKGAPPDEFFTISLLYFLYFLFVYTLFLLPLFLYLRGSEGRRYIESLVGFLSQPWAIYLLAIPIGVIEAGLGTDPWGAWNRFAWVPFILYGFLIAADGRFGAILQRHWRSALILAVLGYAIWMVGMGMLMQVFEVDPSTDFGPIAILVRFLKGMASWFFVIAIMGLAGRLTQPGGERKVTAASSPAGDQDSPPPKAVTSLKSSLMDRVGTYAKDARLPFYVIHHVPVVVIGFYVVQWQAGALLKYVVICLSSIVATLIIYDLGVRRTSLTRFLFGVK